ncbi:malate dehydrogenase [Candidatus Daviesbacteria bacterium RIFCSPLOWO2_12_FULL_38_10]|nr:MAG: malate dehydrogenase [Candidatus Daviesbacteria bacterium RIFCSPLOWO2_12_FULL_38_10]
MNYGEEALKLHKKFQGKLGIVSRVALKTRHDLSLAYTPGVGAVSEYIAQNPKAVYDLTLKGRTVAVISDGSAVLGLGNLGPEAALSVMEGKCLIFKEFAGLDAFPIVIDEKDPKEIIKIIKAIAPTFAAINLEDISAPRCFEIEEALMDLGIPVMHDDQHGTAIAILGPLRATVGLSKRNWFGLKVVISGAGAAGTAVAKMLTCHEMDSLYCSAVFDVIVVDSKGIIHRERKGLDSFKMDLAKFTNKNNAIGDLSKALEGADVFIGLSRGGVLKPEYIKKMAKDPIIFAMANPDPEIIPADAKKMGVRFIATGRSDFPNQVNNALVFPGIIQGAIKARAKKITPRMKLAAAEALSRIIKDPTPDNFVPSIFDPEVVKTVSLAVHDAS